MPLFPPFASAVTVPGDNNYVGWSYDSSASVQSATILPTAGLLNLVRIRVMSSLVTNVHLHITVPGATLTADQCLAALFTAAGVLLAPTGNMATVWQGGGNHTMPLSSPQATTFGAFHYVGFYANGSTLPTFSRALNSSSAINNPGLAAPNFRYATANSGLTTAMPASFGAQTGTATAWWAGVS